MVNVPKWKKWTIGELISQTKTTIQTGPFGTVLSASEFVDYGIPVISVREIREGFIRVTDETPCVTDETFTRLGKYALSANDIIFSRKGSVDRSAVIPDSAERYFLGSDGIRIRFDENVVDPHLMLYIFQNPSTKQFLTQSAYGTTMAGLNEKILSALEFYLPEATEEQKHIAQVLSDIDKQLALTEKMIAKKKAIKQGTMQELLSGNKRLPGFSGEWSDYCIGEMGTFYGGLSGKSKKDFGRGNAHYITFLNVLTNVIIDTSILESVDVKENEAQNKVKKGDLFFNTSSETPEEVGMCAVLEENLKNTFLNSFCFGFRLKDDSHNPLFLSYYLNSSIGRKIMSVLAQGATRYNLSKNSFSATVIALPNKMEQDAIASILSNMDSEIEALEQKLAKYRQIKQGMMQQLLTGKIRLV